ncbi:MAG: hypothetical protein ACR2QV_14895 [Gammaproteobacteria bacterium]
MQKESGHALAASRLNACRRSVILVAALLLACPGQAQVNIDAYRDYFLVGQFGEVCTMCEVVVLCAAGDAPPEHIAPPAQGEFTLYHLQTRTFWSQISTIWEWFVSNFTADALAARGHTRPVHVYTVANDGWSPREVVEGRLVLDPGILEFGDRNIDRVTRAWTDAATGVSVGYCTRMSLWESLDSIAANAPSSES